MDDASNAKPFAGISSDGIKAYKWGNGYAWSVTFHKVSNKLALDAPLHSLAPASASLSITGGKQYIVRTHLPTELYATDVITSII